MNIHSMVEPYYLLDLNLNYYLSSYFLPHIHFFITSDTSFPLLRNQGDNDWGFGWKDPYKSWMQTKIIPKIAAYFDHLVILSTALPLCIRPLCKPHGNFPIPVPLDDGRIWNAKGSVFFDLIAIVLGLYLGCVSSPPKGIVHFLLESPVAYYRRCCDAKTKVQE